MDVLDMIYFIGIVASAALSAVCGVLSFSHARKCGGASVFHYMLTGFYACIVMCDVFYLLTWFLADYPYMLSPGVLSWMGAIVFLITAALDFVGKWTPEQKEAAKKHRLPALTASAVCVAVYVACIVIYPETTFIYLLDAVPTAILAYYALWLFLAGGKGSAQPAIRPYCLLTLSWIAADLSHNMFTTLGWDYGWAVHSTISLWLLTLVTPCVYIAARKVSAA